GWSSDVCSSDLGGISADHVATENILKESGVAWTLLRNSVYMDGLASQGLNMIDSGRATVSASGTGMGYVTRADCAEAAAAVLTTPGHEGKTYDITGPELVGPREIAAAAAAVSGKDLAITVGGGGGGFGSAGLDFVSQDFETITGRRATSTRELLAPTVAARGRP